MADLVHVQSVLRRWDPIGVITEDEFGAPDDEYDSYAPGIVSLLSGGADVVRVADRLAELRRTSMGLPPDQDSDRRIAQELVSWWRS